ncbi:adenylate cyclase [Pseudoduganella flava]|uniref:Adenylate cyclase n=1 Tax=Pseudoduganella flava TaxID=871742 RepID=A0A562PVG8_9BURK|nr:adenylate/guanylate cyclase domain-containing protein [Pseudoduganella flava]QGZ39522.1 CHASE2 domain-containing protein [Pseudoduganella flava]TWI48414.1 adenylate cyclase [Pseudoduganella flava]
MNISSRSAFRQSALLAHLLIGLLAVSIGVWAQYRNGPSIPGDEWLRDIVVRLQASPVPEERLVVVDIDESSLRRSGAWPWSRDRLAHLIENLVGPYGARGVALDIVLPEPADRTGDERLAMLARFGPLVLPHSFVFDGNVPLRVGQLTGGTPGPVGGAVVANGYIANHAGLAGARQIGNIGFVPDQDGMLRRLPMRTWFERKRYPTLSLALLECCGGKAAAIRGPTAGLTSGDGLQRIPYSRAWEAYLVVPAADVLQQTVPADWFRGKLVLIGSSALGLADRVATPLHPNTSGLLVHAAALTGQLDAREGLAPAPWPGRAIGTAFVVLLSIVGVVTLATLPAVANAALLGGASLLWLGAAYVIAPHDAQFSLIGPLLSALTLVALGVPVAWQSTQRHSRRLLGTLRQYVADAVVDELLRSDLADPLTPVRREVTTLIADMQGYTTHVEALPVEQAAQLTRDFLNCLSGPVLDHRGTLDKFTGDGLVAFWGAPLPVADHADQALDAALDIILAIRAFNARRAGAGLAPLRVRIGIESGIAVAGDFGSAARSIYTAVGDSVNVASRLESAARDLPYDLIIGPGTAALAQRHALTGIGRTQLRGREQHTELYTLTALTANEG